MRTIPGILNIAVIIALGCQPMPALAADRDGGQTTGTERLAEPAYDTWIAQNTPRQNALETDEALPANGDRPTTGLHSLSLDQLAVELSNPVTSMFTFDNQFQYRLYQGSLAEADDESAFIYQLQPSFPVALDNGRTVQIRFRIPINGDQPIYEADEEYSPFLIRQRASTIPKDGTFNHSHGHSHLADIGFDIAYGGVSDSGFISMYGIAGKLPSSQDLSQSVDQIQLGPEVAFGKVTDWGIWGAWATHLTRVSGEDEWDTNMTSIQVFFAYGLGNGWQIISNPNIEYDWEGDKDNKLFLPIGGGVAKTMKFGRMPMKMSFEVQYYLASPDAIGPQWLMTLGIRPAKINPRLN